MGVRIGILLLLVLGTSWACADATRELVSDVSFVELSYQEPEREIQASKAEGVNEVCTLCEELTTTALNYLAQDKIQRAITKRLHGACSETHSFKHKCLSLVDYYVPLFFSKISMIQPKDLCSKAKLCGELVVAAPQYQDSCDLCHHAIAEILAKLNDPDTQLDIIGTLLKGCDAVEKYVKQCKKLVIEYGPIILINAEQFLEKTDFCTTFHACKEDFTSGTKQASSLAKTSLLSEI